MADGCLLAVHMAEREEERELFGLFLQGHKAHRGDPPPMTPSNPSCLPKVPSPCTITLDIRASTYELGTGVGGGGGVGGAQGCPQQKTH